MGSGNWLDHSRQTGVTEPVVVIVRGSRSACRQTGFLCVSPLPWSPPPCFRGVRLGVAAEVFLKQPTRSLPSPKHTSPSNPGFFPPCRLYVDWVRLEQHCPADGP